MAELRHTDGATEKTYKLDGPFTIGRTGEQSLLLEADPNVSGNDARLDPAPGGFAISDLESRNGTFIERGGSEWKIQGQFTLASGDVIRVGKTKLVYSASDQTMSSIEQGATMIGRVVPVARER